MDNEFEDYCVTKIDEYLSNEALSPKVKRKFKETSDIYGTVYKFSHFGIEVIRNQVTIFGKYKRLYFDAEAYENTDKLLDELLPTITKYYHNPVLTKHPVIRFFSRVK